MQNEARLPIIKSFFDPNALAQRISEAYGLSLVQCQLIKATMRDIYHVTSSEGAFIGVVYRAGYTPESIREEIELTDYLAGEGLSVASAVRQKNQDYLFALTAPEGIRYLVLLRFVAGTISRKPDRDILWRYGALVADFHRLTDRLPRPKARPTYDADALIVESMKTLEATTGYLETFLGELRHIADKIYPMLQALPKTKPQFGIVHADIIPSNALIKSDGSLTLIDFDLFGVGWRTYDIASYLNEISFWQMGEAAASTFLDGYNSRRPLNPDEVRTLPVMQLARHISSLRTAAANVNTWGSSIYLSDRVVDAAMNSIRELDRTLGSSG